jgi:hypothetical protein
VFWAAFLVQGFSLDFLVIAFDCRTMAFNVENSRVVMQKNKEKQQLTTSG